MYSLIVQIAIVITSPRPPSCFTLVEASLKNTQKGGLSGVEVEPELIAKHIGNSGRI